jgi:hypothetical protein
MRVQRKGTRVLRRKRSTGLLDARPRRGAQSGGRDTPSQGVGSTSSSGRSSSSAETF